MTYDEILLEDADKLLSFGNEYSAVIAVENAVAGIPVNEGDVVAFRRGGSSGYGYGDTGLGSRHRESDDVDKRNAIKRKVEDESDDAKDEVADEKKFNNAIKALTAAASAVTGGAVATAAQGGGKTAGIVALASAVVTAAGAIGQQLHDKHRVQKIKADSLDKLDEKLDDITVKLNTAGPGEKRDLLVARDALKKAKTEITKM